VSERAYIPTTIEKSVAALPPPNIKRHLIAAALSAVVPGAGQLYLGKPRKALVIFVVLIASSIGFWPLHLARSYSSLVPLIWVLLALTIYAVYEALLGRDVITCGRLSRWWIVAVMPFHYIGFNLLFTSLLFGSGFHTARNLGSSMEPTLVNRERFVYDAAYYRSRPKRRGDVVIMHSLFIKRIAAVGGDTIEGKQQQILLNGQPLSEPFIRQKSSISDDPDQFTFGPVTVASGKYFVLGDNLDMSLDSRTPSFGLVDENAIVGKALYSYQFTGTPLSRRLD
jgi:signal peptidase I